MRLAVIGATGYVGRRVVDEGLGRGHEVTALVRNVARVPDKAGLAAAPVDVNDPEQVAEAVSGHDVVISCFHPGGHDLGENPHAYRDIVEGTRTMIEGVRRSPVGRIVYVGGCGSLYVRPGVMLVDDQEFLLRHAHRGRPDGTYPVPSGPPPVDIPLGARMALNLFRLETEIEWTFVSPSRFLGDFGGRSGRLVYGTDHLLMEDGAPAKVDVEDLAVAVVEEAQTGRHVGGHLTVATGS